jgi:hypothetical protein
MDFSPNPTRISTLSETQRAALVHLKEQWNRSHRIGDDGPELDDLFLLKFAQVTGYDITAAQKRVTHYVNLSRKLGGGLGSDTKITEDVAFVLDACIVRIDETNSGEKVISVNAQRCINAFNKHDCTAIVVARTLIYLFMLATDDDSGFNNGLSVVFDLRGPGIIQNTTSIMQYETIFSPIGVFPVRINKIYVIIPAKEWLGSSLSDVVHRLFTSSVDFISDTQLQTIWGGEEKLAHVPKWEGGKLGEVEEKLEASAFVAKRKYREGVIVG